MGLSVFLGSKLSRVSWIQQVKTHQIEESLPRLNDPTIQTASEVGKSPMVIVAFRNHHFAVKSAGIIALRRALSDSQINQHIPMKKVWQQHDFQWHILRFYEKLRNANKTKITITKNVAVKLLTPNWYAAAVFKSSKTLLFVILHHYTSSTHLDGKTRLLIVLKWCRHIFHNMICFKNMWYLSTYNNKGKVFSIFDLPWTINNDFAFGERFCKVKVVNS